MIKTAVILAAGKGTRFGVMTEIKPKGFINFNGKPMVIRSIENLISTGISNIIIGTGYHKEWYEKLQDIYPQVTTVFSKEFAETNSMETLYVCNNKIGSDDFLLLESDIVYEKDALKNIIEDSHSDVMLVSPVRKFQDQYYIATDNEGRLTRCSTDKDLIFKQTGKEPVGELVGIHKISNEYYKKMLGVYLNNRKVALTLERSYRPEKIGYEFYLEEVATGNAVTSDKRDMTKEKCDSNTVSTSQPKPLYVYVDNNLQWYEIDDERDLDFAQKNVKL